MSSFTIAPNAQSTRGFTFDPDLLPDDDEGNALAQRIYDLIVPYGELTQRKRENDIASYSTQHECLVQERRKLAEQEQSLLEEQSLLMAETTEVDNALSKAKFDLKIVRENPPRPMWSTKADWDAHNSAIADAEKVLEEAILRQAEHNLSVTDWRERFAEVHDSIKNLAENVGRVWNKLQASKGTNAFAYSSETGLKQC